MTTPHRPKPTQAPKKPTTMPRADHPPPEEEYGGGDFVAPEVSTPTEDDKPLE